MTLRYIEYVDAEGRSWRRALPDGVPDSKAATGIPAGPPAMTELGLPRAVEIRLHNQLYARGLFSEEDVRRNPAELTSALIAAYRVDAQRILIIYHG